MLPMLLSTSLDLAPRADRIGLATLDPAGIVLGWTEGAERLTGIPRRDALGRHLEFLDLPEDRDASRVRSELRQAAKAGVFETARERRRHDGSAFSPRTLLCPVRSGHGELTGFTLVLEEGPSAFDVDRAVERARRLELLGSLVAGVSHDFNNSLAGIRGHLEFALREIPDAHAARADLEAIARLCESASSLTGRLLAVARKNGSQPRPVSACEVLRELQPVLHRVLGETVDVRVEASGQEDTVLVDRSDLERIVLNLAVNARDAMPGGGVLHLQVATVRKSRRPPLAHVRLTVSDNGHGMDGDTLDHAFEPFFTTKGDDGGTGLGLHTVRTLVRAAGGFVEVDSAPGAGTKFFLYFPLAEPAPAASETPVRAVLPIRPRTILLAEDEEVLRHLLVRYLEGLGHTVLSARDGDQALALLEQVAPRLDMAVLDAVMPGCSGLRVREELRRRRPDVPAILISGYGEPLEGDEPPTTSYLAKPFRLPDLALRIDRLTEGADS